MSFGYSFTTQKNTIRGYSLLAMVASLLMSIIFLSGAAMAATITLPAAGIISTVAGSGTGCAGQTDSVGDGCAATSAELYGPTGVAVDAAGNIYIADEANNRIRKVTASTGLISTVVDMPVDEYPTGVAVDTAGNLYIDDGGGIEKVTASTGIVTTVAGGGSYPGEGDGGPATNASFYYPAGVAVDAAGNLYIADEGDFCIRAVNMQATTQTILGVSIKSGDIQTVAGINGSGGSTMPGLGGPATSAELEYPTGVAVDAAGNLYIVGYGPDIYKVTASTGIISGVASGGPDDSGVAYPYGVAVDGAGNLYLGNGGNVLKWTASTGLTSTVAGGGGGCAGQTDSVGDGCAATSAELSAAYGVAVDHAGNLYIASSGTYASYSNSRIRVVGASEGIAPPPVNSGTYTITPNTQSITGSGDVTLTLTSNTYVGTVSFVTTVASTDGTATDDVAASASPVTLTAGGSETTTLTITANSNAAKHAPGTPWTGSGMIVFGALLGAPFAAGSRKRILKILLVAAAITLVGFTFACGKGTGSTVTPPPSPSAQTYLVTVTPTGTGQPLNPTPVTISVTVD